MSLAPRHEFGIVRAMWWRDMLRLKKERSRWLGVLLQPLLFWFVIGSGMGGVFQMPGAGGVSYLEFFYPGVLVMVVLFTTIFATISVVEDRQMGFLQAVVVAPGSRASMVLGKIAGVTTLVLIQSVLFLFLAPMAGYSFGAIAWVSLFVVLVLGSVGLTAVGFFMAWTFNSTQGYHAVMSVVLIPLWIVSGAMFPMRSSWLGVVAAINPMSYIVSGIRHALAPAKAAFHGAGMGVSLSALVGFAVVSVALASWAARKGS
ncbi:MAG: ABC transporter permease [Deltaproteobacteria bacterium]|nr:ABC transporter permease [Deltaproteobacteria bacterium]